MFISKSIKINSPYPLVSRYVYSFFKQQKLFFYISEVFVVENMENIRKQHIFLTLFIFFIYFYQLEANYFTILQWFLSYIDMNQPWIYMYSPSQSPLPPPSLPNSSGFSQYTRPEHLSHASHLGWCSVSPQIIYMFRSCSLETSHPLLLPQSPKVCFVHVSLFLFCMQGYHYHLSKFHIYVLVY